MASARTAAIGAALRSRRVADTRLGEKRDEEVDIGIVRVSPRAAEPKTDNSLTSSRSTGGLQYAVDQAGVPLADVVVVGLDTPGPASAGGVLSARGSTNFGSQEDEGALHRQKVHGTPG